MTLAPGGFVDDAQRYELVSRIATGGMGEVWRARDTSLQRSVAVKVLKAEYADDPTFRTRFETEARHAASLHHPGIAGVFDYGEAEAADGSGAARPYLVMELVEGEPLSALLRPGAPMAPAVARDLMAQAADALGAAHARGIVHRDVKPANLIVTPDRRVKVTDFGIARAAEGMSLTETGQVLGTPAYISPEQAEGGRSSAASDVYSLAVVAFECLAGRKPFVADTPVATAVAHVRNPVPELPDAVPGDLAAVVRRSLAKDPAERPADGLALAAALRSGEVPTTPATAVFATTPVAAPVDAPPPSQPTSALPTAAPASSTDASPRRSRPPWALLAGLLAVLVAVVLAVALASTLTGGDDPEDTPPTSGAPSTTASETPTQSPSQSPTETPTPTPAPAPTSATVEVDPADYIGRDVGDVTSALRDLGLKPQKEKVDNPGDQPEDTVAGVEPSGTLEEGDEVTVSYYDKVPSGSGEPGENDTSSDGEGNQG